MLTKKLNEALNDPILSDDNIKKVKDIMQMLESYKLYATNLMNEKQHIFGDNIKKEFQTKNEESCNKNDERKELWNYKSPKPSRTYIKPTDEENWRTLKPNPNQNSQVFFRGYQKQTSTNSLEARSPFNSKS